MPATYQRITQKLADSYTGGVPDVAPNTFIRDIALTGFGIAVQRTKSSYFVEGNVGRAGRNVRIVLGVVGRMALDDAICNAKATTAQLAAGNDPVKALRDERAAKRLDALTLNDALDEMEKSKQVKNSTLHDYRRSIDALGWLDRRIVDLADAVGPAYRERLATPTSAGRIMRSLRSVWNFARRDHPTLPAFPSPELKKARKKWSTAPRKQRIIPDALLPKWRKQVDALEREDVRDFILLMHYTGLRLGEARALEVQHVDQRAGYFVVADPKNGKPAQLPIVRQVAPILTRRIKAVKSGPLFPFGDVRKSHVSVDAAPWSYHDLRRQYVTAERRSGIDDLIARRLTNHASPDDDAHAGYAILNADALRTSAQTVADWLDQCGRKGRRKEKS